MSDIRGSLPIQKALRAGWQIFKNNILMSLSIIILPQLITFLNQMVPTYVDLAWTNLPSPLWRFIPLFSGISSAILWLALYLISAVANMASLKIALMLVDDQKPRLSEVFIHYHLLGRYILTNLLYMVIVGIGFCLLIVPGVIWAIKYQYALILVVDKGMRPLDAFRVSAELTDGVKWSFAGFSLLSFVLCILGLALFLVGWFVVWSVITLAWVYLLRYLQSYPSTSQLPLQSQPSLPKN